MRIIAGFLGEILVVMGLVLMVPMFAAPFMGEAVLMSAFLYPAAGSIAIGAVLYRIRDRRSPTTAQAMVICALAWFLLSAVGSLPFRAVLGVSWTDALFESTCGFTTTGATVLRGLDFMPRSILLWRSLSQWIGGLGILTFFLAIASRVPGAHRLAGAEGNAIFSGRPVPGLLHTVKILWTLYAAFTAITAVLLILAGMDLFDGINHGMTIVSTGGFSTRDAGIGWYAMQGNGNGILIEYAAILGMLAGGTSFIVHYRAFRGEGIRAYKAGTEVLLWWLLIGSFTAVILLEQGLRLGFSAIRTEFMFRRVLFHVVSLSSSAGFTTENLGGGFFGPAAQQLFLLMMLVGGCSGSTSGGIRVFRFSVLWKVASEEYRRVFRSQRAVSGARFQGALLDRRETERIAGILFIWLLLILTGGVLTAVISPGTDGLEAFSGMFSAVGNTGPSLLTPETVRGMPGGVKIIYITGMFAGRLEILPLLVLFSRKAWR
jgi:trk system potassium uptake protein